MAPALLLLLDSSTRKYILIVLATLAIVIALPFMAVFALGTNTLSFLVSSVVSSVDGSSSSQTQGLYQGPLVPGDYYAWGNCTYWVFYLRQQAGDQIPANWGNASTWAINAILQGYSVDRAPSVGAIMQISDVDNGLGHVAYVESVDPTSGAWTISEMNVEGLDIVDTRTYPASAASGFEFIHDKKVTPGGVL
jgi:surface antigen